jgi:hypothetical protein
MIAFFLSIMVLLVLLVIATAICVALRFGGTQQEAPSSDISASQEEYLERPRRHFGGPLALSLILLFSVTLVFAVITR